MNCLLPGMFIQLHRFASEIEPEAAISLNALYPQGVSRFGAAILSGRTMNLSDLVREREQRLEEIRLSDYPNCPSRFTTVFACLSVEEAQEFRRRVGSQEAKIWKLEGLHYSVKDMSFLQDRPPMALEKDGHRYWQGHASNAPFWECLVTPPVKVIEIVG